jgi:hypothetical protein
LHPGEFRAFGNNIDTTTGALQEPSPLPQPFSLHYDGKPHPTKPSTDSQLLGTATDMRLRVDKGTGVDFNPDGTKMFQSVACYYDPSLKDKYKNVIGYHQLAKPWDVGTTDFLVKEELNDIIYCDEKYSEVKALHPDMRVCCLTFRPDGMGFYFAYVVHSLTSQNIEYYFVQQDLTVPWELSSAKEEYKYSNKISHLKAPQSADNQLVSRPNLWQINGMTVSQNGRFIHAVYPHNYLVQGGVMMKAGLAKPRQFEMTTPWDISTAGNVYVGVAEDLPGIGYNMGHEHSEPTHAVYWDDTGENCYFSYVIEGHKLTSGWDWEAGSSFYKQNRFGLKKE